MYADSSPKTGLLFTLLIAFQPLCSNACADTPASNLDYDQIVARIPPDQAPISSVALANLNIVLYNARQQAAVTLCGGQWTPLGSLVFQQGPVASHSPPQASAIPSWHYTALRYPRMLPCSTSSRAVFFMEMSRHLPAWVTIRPAGQLTAFRQGETVLPGQENVAFK